MNFLRPGRRFMQMSSVFEAGGINWPGVGRWTGVRTNVIVTSVPGRFINRPNVLNKVIQLAVIHAPASDQPRWICDLWSVNFLCSLGCRSPHLHPLFLFLFTHLGIRLCLFGNPESPLLSNMQDFFQIWRQNLWTEEMSRWICVSYELATVI